MKHSVSYDPYQLTKHSHLLFLLSKQMLESRLQKALLLVKAFLVGVKKLE